MVDVAAREKRVERTEISNRIIDVIRPLVKNQAALNDTSDSTSILTDLEVNSARLVDLVLSLEDEFGIEVDDEAAEQVETLGDIVELVIQKLT